MKRKREYLMGMIFKNLPNKWVLKGQEMEYKRMTEELRKKGIDYTPPPPDHLDKK